MSKTKKVSVQSVAEYGGHNVKANGIAEVSLCFKYSELVDAIQLLQMLNNDVTMFAKPAGQKQVKLGMFRIKNINIDNDGESKIRFVSDVNAAEVEVFHNIATKESFKVKFDATIELEVEDDSESGEWE